MRGYCCKYRGVRYFSYVPESYSLKWKNVLCFLCKFLQLLDKEDGNVALPHTWSLKKEKKGAKK